MSVTTTADQKLEQAKEKLKEAQALLGEAMDENTWGSRDFKVDYIDGVYEVMGELFKLRRKL